MRRFFTSSALCSGSSKKSNATLTKAHELFKEFKAKNEPNWREKSYKEHNVKSKPEPEKLNRKARRSFKRTKENNSTDPPKDPTRADKKEAQAALLGQDADTQNTELEQPNPTTVSLISSASIDAKQYHVPGQAPVPHLANNLDRVLFNPGVHFLKDVRTNVYNFPPSLENIMSIRDFDFSKIPAFVPSGKDNKLSRLAQKENKRYTASTSSITGTLGLLHQALSYGRPPSLMGMSKHFKGKTTTFTSSQTMPTKFALKYNQVTNTHAIAPVGNSGDETVLSLLGQAMEMMLVTETTEFANYDRLLSHLLPKDDPVSTYNYMQCGSFMLRSQLDCHDPRLPGTGHFDLKTRAVCAVRHDMDFSQVRNGCDYQIIKRDGYEESYAREFYELIRSALFKYSLQARIGSMDGIFVAYHNINNLFGFEYLPLEEIDVIFHTSHLFTQRDPTLGYRLPPDIHETASMIGPIIAEKEFSLSIGVLEKLLDTIIEGNPKADYLVYLQTSGRNGLNVIFREYNPEEAQGITNEKFEKGYSGFRCVLTGSVNGVEVENHPHLESKEDKWEVALELEHMASSALGSVKESIMKSYVPHELTSKPLIERTPHDNELEKEAMEKLADPSAFQMRLRELQQKGRLFKRENDKREKLVWEPKSEASS